MKYYLASVDPAEIAIAKDYGVHGILTNPTVLANAGRPWRAAVQEAASLVDGPFHVQVVSDDRDGILRETDEFYGLLGDRLVVKICLSREGLAAAQQLGAQGIPVNITALVTALQAFGAVQSGVPYVTIYMGRADTAGIDSKKLMEDVKHFVDLHGYSTQLVAASIREPEHLYAASLAGANLAACPLETIEEALVHPVTIRSIAGFKEDFARIPVVEQAS